MRNVRDKYSATRDNVAAATPTIEELLAFEAKQRREAAARRLAYEETNRPKSIVERVLDGEDF